MFSSLFLRKEQHSFSRSQGQGPCPVDQSEVLSDVVLHEKHKATTDLSNSHTNHLFSFQLCGGELRLFVP